MNKAISQKIPQQNKIPIFLNSLFKKTLLFIFILITTPTLNPLVITIEDIAAGVVSAGAGAIASYETYLQIEEHSLSENFGESEKTTIMIAVGIGLCTSIITWMTLRNLIPSENFHTVEKEKLYRSAQLTPERLATYIEAYSIKTIINLRGKDEQKLWWQQEAAVTKQLGIALYDIAMSADELTPKEKLLQLLYIYKTAPKPILIHCYSGRDRTGEAAAIWVLEMMELDVNEALNQLAFIPYLHIRYLHPAKSFLISQWKEKDWFVKEYNETNYPEF